MASNLIKNTITTSYNEFALNLYQKLKKDANLFFSSFSIETALAMCYAGAKNETEKQLKELLRFVNTDKKITHEMINYIHSGLENSTDKIELNIANKIYPQENYKINQSFIDIVRNYYKSDVQCLDYSKSKDACQIINKWVEEQTKQKIKELVSETVIDSLTRLVLVNAIYFKGKWLHKFDENKTSKQEFHLSDGSTTQVDMMKIFDQSFQLKINPQSIRANICEIPYVGEKVSMSIILPNEGVKIEEVENQLNGNVLTNVLQTTALKNKVHVYIPKFKFEESFELANVLSSMNAPDPFDENKADFSDITDVKPGLFISNVIHKSIIEVDEIGTVGAAATAVVMKLRCAKVSVKQIPEFKCDRPFIFVIHENSHKTILFIGKYCKPL